MRLNVRRFVAVFVLGVLNNGSAAEPDPLALLEGVRGVRVGIGAGRMKMQATYKTPLGTNVDDYTIVFKGDKRRTDVQTAGKPQERAAYDGTDVMHFDGVNSAILTGINRQSFSFYLFDPRELGISHFYSWSHTIDQCLNYRNAMSVKLLGPEELGGAKTWHVDLIDSRGHRREFWIDDSEHFAVRKARFRDKSRDIVTMSTYDNTVSRILPTRVETIRYDKDGKAETHRTIVISNVELEVPIDDSVFTLGALGLPAGTPVSDVRLKKRIGYWNGKHPVEDPRRPDPLPDERGGSSGKKSRKGFYLGSSPEFVGDFEG